MATLVQRKCPDCSTWMDGAWRAVEDVDEWRCRECGTILTVDSITGQILRKGRIPRYVTLSSRGA